MTVLLDTSVASLLLPSPRPRPKRSIYKAALDGEILALSFQSVAELWLTAENNGTGESVVARACGNSSMNS